ncbi:MAG: DUF6263 family protein [Candidatus Omnitrophica bacterium]|nr:DUF6263 family protein [Candidatus Omnitrophota bacterium]
MRKILFVCLLFCILSFTQEETSKEYEIKYLFTKGSNVSYSLKIDTIEKLNISGQYNEKKRKVVIDFDQIVENVDENGNGIIKMKYLGGSYDGIKVDLAGKEVTLKRNSKGEILESVGLEELSAEFVKIIQKSLSDYVPGFDRIPVKIDFSKFDSNMFNVYLESFTPVFPDKKIKIGESWEKEIMIPIFFTKGTLVYTLEKIEDNKAYINVSITKKQIKGTGELIFDIEKGYIIEQNLSIRGENVKTKVDLGQYAPQYAQSFDISGSVIIKISLFAK